MKKKKLKYAFLLIIFFEITGNFWIYPEKTSKSWDCTLAHLSYYSLRKECFEYIDQKHINYSEITAGFSIYGDRNIIELSNIPKIVNSERDRKYFIYSNISNLPDDWIDDFNNIKLWMPIKRFEKGFVKIIIYERVCTSAFTKGEK